MKFLGCILIEAPLVSRLKPRWDDCSRCITPQMNLPSEIPQIECCYSDLDDGCDPREAIRLVGRQLTPLIPNGATIVSIDGFDGVGKTTLADELSKAFCLPLVSPDNYLMKEKGYFFKALKFDVISNEIEEYFRLAKGVIVEGCLVELALEQIRRRSDFRIYVMRISRMRSAPEVEFPEEYEVLYGESSTKEMIAKLEEMARNGAAMPEEFGGGGSGELPGLQRELVAYHRDRRPHDHADVIVKVVRLS